jgi:allantoate deiminase/N-carbamoyl-L-amino-acid hydrolase
MAWTIEQLNVASKQDFMQATDGLYEHSPWVAERCLILRPFRSLDHFKAALSGAVQDASRAEQLALLRAHPELAGKAAVSGQLTAESTSEQGRSGLNQCSPEEFATLQQLNADYNAKFGFPFIIAVRGPTGLGLTRVEIIAVFQQRLNHDAATEFSAALSQVDRIAALRLQDRITD